MKLAIVLAEFGMSKPDTAQFARYFPGADIRVYGTGDVPPTFEPHERWGWRMNDYWKVKKLLTSEAEIAISFDADMRIVSDDVQALELLADNFGLCLPANPRHLVRVDTMTGADSDGVLDETNGTGHAYNCSPIALCLANRDAVQCAEEYCRQMLFRPVRGPVAWWRAAWETGFAPYLLPPQWCVCAENVGIGNEIILHEGHEAVRNYYRGRK